MRLLNTESQALLNIIRGALLKGSQAGWSFDGKSNRIRNEVEKWLEDLREPPEGTPVQERIAGQVYSLDPEKDDRGDDIEWFELTPVQRESAHTRETIMSIAHATMSEYARILKEASRKPHIISQVLDDVNPYGLTDEEVAMNFIESTTNALIDEINRDASDKQKRRNANEKRRSRHIPL